jgi:hypothetical protein
MGTVKQDRVDKVDDVRPPVHIREPQVHLAPGEFAGPADWRLGPTTHPSTILPWWTENPERSRTAEIPVSRKPRKHRLKAMPISADRNV